jgi:hypothetical protein
MRINITSTGDQDAIPERSAFADATVRPENLYEPPSGEEILKTWSPENFPLPFQDEDNLPYMTFSKDSMHAILHRPLDGVEYHAAMVYHESQGFIYICDCYSTPDACQIYCIGGLLAFAPFLIGDEDGSQHAN